MSNTEKFCLRWNDFESNISVAFRELREEKDFFDVTLACDDSQVQAHKVILSACSPFFRNVLRRNPHQHPLLYLKGVKYRELLAVLNFMYMGEVNVAQEELNSFLSVAEDLRVKGLTQGSAAESSKVESRKEAPKPQVRSHDSGEKDSQSFIKRPRPNPQPTQTSVSHPIHSYQDDDIQEVVPVKSEPREHAPVPVAAPIAQQSYHHPQEQSLIQDDQHQQGTLALEDSYADENYDYGQYEEGYDDGSGLTMGTDANKGLADYNDVKTSLEVHMEKISSDSFICTICHYHARQSHHILNHIESKHMNGGHSYLCDQCDQVCPTKNALNAHKSRKHRKKLNYDI